MNHRLVVAATLCMAAAFPAGLSAQQPTFTTAFDYGLGFGDIARVLTAGMVTTRPYFKTNRLLAGFGLRMAYSMGDELRHFSHGGSGSDTLRVKNVGIASLNVNLQAAWKFSDDIELGANMDIVGLSYGADRNADLRGGGPGVSGGAQGAQVSWGNLFAFGDDRGTLNSEIYLGYTINTQYKVKFGYMRAWTEYTTPNLVVGDIVSGGDRRFRAGNDVVFLGMRYTP